MNSENTQIPPEHIWIPVWDMPSAIKGLEFLLDYILQFDGSSIIHDHDEV